MSGPLLNVSNLTVRFGGVVALDGLSLEVTQSAIHAVIGPNGAGKSTLLNVITGLTPPDAGGVSLDGQAIERHPPHILARMGIARTFQNTELFGELSALENVVIAADRHYSYGVFSGMSRNGRFRRSEKAVRQEAQELLNLVGIGDEASVAAAALPFGKQRRVEIARALAGRPKLLLLDEPAAGLRSAEVDFLNRILLKLRERGLTILLIDHVMTLVMAISDRISVLNFGRKIAEGDPQTVRASSEVIKAYLGEKAAHAYGT